MNSSKMMQVCLLDEAPMVTSAFPLKPEGAFYFGGFAKGIF